VKKELPKHLKVYLQQDKRPAPAAVPEHVPRQEEETESSSEPTDEMFQDAEEHDEEDLETFAPPSTPSTPVRFWNALKSRAPPLKHLERAKKIFWDASEGSLNDRILKQEARCRRLKDIEKHVEAELRGAKDAEAKAETHYHEQEGIKTNLVEGARHEMHKLDGQKDKVHAELVKKLEQLAPHILEARKAWHEARHEAKTKEHRVEKVRKAWDRCRHEGDAIAVDHAAHASHAAALLAATKAAKATDAAKRSARIF